MGCIEGGGQFQVPGENLRPVRRRMDGGPLGRREGLQGMDLAGEASTEGGGQDLSVRHFKLGGVPGSPHFWGGDLGLFRGDVQEYGGGTHDIPKANNRTEVSAIEGRDLEAGGSRGGT